jgi:hypothetical protein
VTGALVDTGCCSIPHVHCCGRATGVALTPGEVAMRHYQWAWLALAVVVALAWGWSSRYEYPACRDFMCLRVNVWTGATSVAVPPR